MCLGQERNTHMNLNPNAHWHENEMLYRAERTEPEETTQMSCKRIKVDFYNSCSHLHQHLTQRQGNPNTVFFTHITVHGLMSRMQRNEPTCEMHVNDIGWEHKKKDKYPLYLDKSSPNTPQFPAASQEIIPVVPVNDVRRSFNTFNTGKAAKPDGISGCVLKTCSDQLVAVCTDNFNLSLIRYLQCWETTSQRLRTHFPLPTAKISQQRTQFWLHYTQYCLTQKTETAVAHFYLWIQCLKC